MMSKTDCQALKIIKETTLKSIIIRNVPAFANRYWSVNKN